MSRTQANRNIAIQTPLGDDVLLLRSFSARETLGRLFQYDLELKSENHEIKFDDIVGQNVTLRLNLAAGQVRYFNGHVSSFSQVQSASRLATYRATMVPWLWFLTRSADCRIFQDKKVPEILTAVFREHGFTDFKESLSGQYRKWDYCVQYRETDFNFVSRLMEQEGIYYFFEHENGKHTLVLADSKSAHQPYPGYATIVYRTQDQTGVDQEYIHDWMIGQEVQPGLYGHTDYNFEKPKVSLLAKSNISRSHAGADFEIFDYPGEYAEYGDGEAYARRRIEELQVQHELAHSSARARGLAAGYLFTLTGHPRPDQNREYLITAYSHQATTDDYDAERAKGGEDYFIGNFTAISSTESFRAARLTPKPVVQGPQTAIVVGPKGEEIHTDKYGRVKVLFHWDRYAKADENSSCWIRVAQSWAGKKWGSIYTPRIGQEVIVEFLEGDPDHPIITGRVYNAEEMPPYPLPDQKTISTLKSNSSKGGGGFNEIRFEDNKGKEQIFIHAERNQDVRVKSNTYESIGHERHLTVKKDQLEKVEGDKHLTVKGNTLAKIEGEQHLKVETARFVQIQGNDNLTTAGDQVVKVDGEQDVHVKMDQKEKVDLNQSLEVGMNSQTKVGMNHALESGMAMHLKAGMAAVIEAGLQLSLKVGGNFIDINPAGVFIQGTLVMINSGGAAGVGSGSSPQSPKDPDPPDKPKEPDPAADAKPGEKDQPPAAPTPPTPVVYSPAAAVLQSAAQDGTPFCEECARAAQQAEEEEEVPVIVKIAWLDGADDREAGFPVQWVNLPREEKWVDRAQVDNLDRLGPKVRYKVTFSKPGSHPFKVTPVPGEENVEYSDAEKGRNANFKWMDQEKQYTTDADGTKIVEADFFTACAGADTFKLVATDENNNPEVETGWLRTGRLVYAVPIIMHGVSTAANLDTFKREFADRGIIFEELRAVEIEPMANIGPDESNTYQQRCKTAFDGSDGQQKVPYAIGIGFTGHLAVKNPNQTLELTGVTVGPDEDPVDIPVMARGLLAGDGLNRRSLWKDLVSGEGWFVSGSYIPDGGGPAQNILEASCTALPEGAQDCSGVLVDVSGLPAGTGTIRLQVNVVDRMRGGLTFPGGNLICICTKAWWQDIDETEQNATAIHEAGHKVGMVCDGTGKLPDKVATQYSNKGHVGNHCYYDLPVMDSYVGAEHSQCVMFGEAGDHPPTAFCPNCAPAVRKMDLSKGWTP